MSQTPNTHRCRAISTRVSGTRRISRSATTPTGTFARGTHERNHDRCHAMPNKDTWMRETTARDAAAHLRHGGVQLQQRPTTASSSSPRAANQPDT